MRSVRQSTPFLGIRCLCPQAYAVCAPPAFQWLARSSPRRSNSGVSSSLDVAPMSAAWARLIGRFFTPPVGSACAAFSSPLAAATADGAVTAPPRSTRRQNPVQQLSHSNFQRDKWSWAGFHSSWNNTTGKHMPHLAPLQLRCRKRLQRYGELHNCCICRTPPSARGQAAQ